MLIIGAAALIFFGPDQLPKVAKRAGQVVREVQNTSQSFIREMERAADDIERRERDAATPIVPPAASHAAAAAAAFSEPEASFPAAGSPHEASPAAAEPPAKPEASRSESYEI
jgi:Sec-independent protein translocase protein TatA